MMVERLHCKHCPARFHTVWERQEHEREFHDPPRWIRVAQDGQGVHGGFWTCAAATENSPKYIRADIHEALSARIAQLEEALRNQFCPRPCNGRPDDFDVGDCVDAGECGCGAALALSEKGGN